MWKENTIEILWAKKWLSLFLATVVFGSVTSASVLRKGPYLIYTGTSSEMQLLWQLDTTQVCTLEWGWDVSYSGGIVLTSEYGSDHQHMYVITGLVEGTRYYYRITDELSNTYTGDFVTSPSPSSSCVKFLVYGDTRTNPGGHDSVCAQIVNTYTTAPGYQTMLLHTGDWTSSDSELDWANEYFPASSMNARRVQSDVAINGCAGNHEGAGIGFRKYWPYPYVTETGFYRSFDYGPCHFAVLDQNVPYSPGSAQYDWLVSDLASSTAAWKFLIFHEPGYSAGGHSNNISVQSYIQPLCLTYGVDMVFCGHNHYYCHCDVQGVKHITTGGGGAPLYPPNSYYPYVVTAAAVNHFCEVDVNDYKLHFLARGVNGSVVDEFTIYHQIPADFNDDGGVDASDLLWLTGRWLNSACEQANNWCDGADMDRLGSADMRDYAIFARYWQEKLPIEIDVRISSPWDDVEELNATGRMYLYSSDLELVNDTAHGGDQTIGLRFQNVGIEQGAVISKAYVQFTVDESGGVNPCSLLIRAEASDDAASFTIFPYDLSNRATTAASALWSPSDWNIVGAAGSEQRTCDISAVVQEVIDRPAWSTGNSLVIIISGTGRRTAQAYEDFAGGAALLHIKVQ
jgi:hypothetical protein